MPDRNDDEAPPRGGAGSPGLRLWNFKPPEWRTAGVLGLLLLLGVGLLMVHPAPAAGSPTTASGGPAPAPASSSPLAAEAAAMDAQLESDLGQIAGVGAVTVAVHLVSGARTEFATNAQSSTSTTEQPAGSTAVTSTQQSTNDQIVVAGNGDPVVADQRAPVVDGVLVVAAGGGDPVVASEVAAAVQAATGVPLYAIVVLPSAESGGS